MMLSPTNAALVSYTCCILHNLISKERPKTWLQDVAPQPHPAHPDHWWQNAQTLNGLQHFAGNTGLDAAKVVRDHLKDYYSSASGRIEDQERNARRHVIIQMLFNKILFSV